MQQPVNRLTEEEFAPYGQVLHVPDGEQDAGGPGWHWYGDRGTWPGAPDGCQFGMLRLDAGSPVCFDWAERHAASAELLVPMDGPVVIHVAPARYPEELAQLPELADFRLFRVEPGQAVLLDAMVWHGAPLAPDAAATVLVMQLTGTGGDNSAVVPFGGETITG